LIIDNIYGIITVKYSYYTKFVLPAQFVASRQRAMADYTTTPLELWYNNCQIQLLY